MDLSRLSRRCRAIAYVEQFIGEVDEQAIGLWSATATTPSGR
jgi:hypothetical protein